MHAYVVTLVRPERSSGSPETIKSATSQHDHAVGLVPTDKLDELRAAMARTFHPDVMHRLLRSAPLMFSGPAEDNSDLAQENAGRMPRGLSLRDKVLWRIGHGPSHGVSVTMLQDSIRPLIKLNEIKALLNELLEDNRIEEVEQSSARGRPTRRYRLCDQ